MESGCHARAHAENSRGRSGVGRATLSASECYRESSPHKAQCFAPSYGLTKDPPHSIHNLVVLSSVEAREDRPALHRRLLRRLGLALGSDLRARLAVREAARLGHGRGADDAVGAFGGQLVDRPHRVEAGDQLAEDLVRARVRVRVGVGVRVRVRVRVTLTECGRLRTPKWKCAAITSSGDIGRYREV